MRPGNNTGAAASLVADLRPGWNTERSYVPCFRLDDISGDVLGSDRPGLIKIDVEGAELDAIKGMAGLLESIRPMVLCEVLRRDRLADAAAHETRCRELMTLVVSLRYGAFAIRRSADDRRVLALETIAAFPNDVWTAETATSCDYLFVPEEKPPPAFH